MRLATPGSFLTGPGGTTVRCMSSAGRECLSCMGGGVGGVYSDEKAAIQRAMSRVKKRRQSGNGRHYKDGGVKKN